MLKSNSRASGNRPKVKISGTQYKVSNDLSGGVFGGHLGCQFQWGSWVFGVEAGADGADIKGSTTATARFLPSPNVQQNSFDTRVKWLATATPRLGFASGPWMYYVKGGFAAAQVDISLSRLTGDNAGISLIARGLDSRDRPRMDVRPGLDSRRGI